MFTAYDAVTVAHIPKQAKIVMGYTDGHYNNIDAMRKAFPDAVVIGITILGDPAQAMCDCENGDLTPSEAAAYAVNRVRRFNKTATIYTFRANLPAVRQAVKDLAGNAKMTRKQRNKILYFCADWTGLSHATKGCVGTQWMNTTNYDVSQINKRWPGVMEPLALHRRIAMRVVLGIRREGPQLPPPDHALTEHVMLATHNAVTLGH